MLFKRIEAKDLAHYSYVIGDRHEAIIIDPRRDCGIYVDLTRKEGMKITQVLETHRNEDYLVGSLELSERTGAGIWHADSQFDYWYGQPVKDNQTWKIGNQQIRAISTPGHTPGAFSYLLTDSSGNPWMMFTGDTLFAGELGRVDLMGPERIREMASLLYESIYGKILPQGDGVIICPAHGAGSVCGNSIVSREWTTIGLEKQLNHKLSLDREDFINAVGLELDRPPYFDRMERINTEGAPLLGPLPYPRPLSPANFQAEINQGAVPVDTRSEMSFGSAHVPGSLFFWPGRGLAGFAGWFLPDEPPLLGVNETDDMDNITRTMIRMGYDNFSGFLSGGMNSWLKSGKKIKTIRTLSVEELCFLLDSHKELFILDVRGVEEINTNGEIPGAHHIHITQIPLRFREIPRTGPVYIFCGSGMRSMVVAAFLQKKGRHELNVILGGFSGWSSTRCPVRFGKERTGAVL